MSQRPAGWVISVSILLALAMATAGCGSKRRGGAMATAGPPATFDGSTFDEAVWQ